MEFEYKYGCFSLDTLTRLGKEGWIGFATHVEHIQAAGEKKEIVIYHLRRPIYAVPQ